ncbi:MAG: hypothetical protein WC047_02690 [Kiritimatiellales bacterium]
MKKTIVLLLALAAGSVFAAMPVEKSITHVSTPFQLGVDEYHCLYPKEYGVHGLRLNCYFVENRYMHGVDLGFWNVSEDASGLQVALYRNETHDFGGIQLSLWNTETKQVGGIQVASVSTDAEDLYGVQLTGLLGKAREVSGIQIGGLTAESESETDKCWAKGIQASLFRTGAENLAGVQIGGVFTESGWYANGVQLGLLFTESRYTRGIQLGGLTARAKETTGIQLGGLMAKSEIKSEGVLQGAIILAETGDLEGCLQLAAVSANVIGKSDGIQIGGISTMAGSLDGLQVAGIWNFVFENVSGAQIGLLYNHARYVRGLQLGLFNHCERLDGVQIGLLNTVKEARFSTCPLLRVDF